MHRYHSKNSDGDRSGSIVIISWGKELCNHDRIPLRHVPTIQTMHAATARRMPHERTMVQWMLQRTHQSEEISMMIPQEMQFSDQDIIRAAINAVSGTKSNGVDLKDIYLELLNCTAYSKIYRYRYEMVSRQRMINLILTNCFRVVGSRSTRMIYAYAEDN